MKNSQSHFRIYLGLQHVTVTSQTTEAHSDRTAGNRRQKKPRASQNLLYHYNLRNWKVLIIFAHCVAYKWIFFVKYNFVN